MSHRLPSIATRCPLGGNIIGTVGDEDSVDPCSLDHHTIWTSLCPCDDVTGSVDSAGVTSVSGSVVGCASVANVVDGTSGASSIGVSGSIVSGVQ